MTDNITKDELMAEFGILEKQNHYGTVTVKMKAGKIMPMIDIKRSKKIKPKNGEENDGHDIRQN
jgi:hypothetical protein